MKKIIFILSLLSNVFFMSQINSKCGQNGILNVGILENNLPFSDLDSQGNPFGFDIDLVNAIAQILNVNVNFRVGTLTELTLLLQNGNIDFIGDSNITINRLRLNTFGFIETNNTTLPCIPLVFLGAIPSIIQSQKTALADLNSVNTVFGSRSDTTSIQNITLQDSGVPQSNIVDVAAFTSPQDFINGFGTNPGQYQALYFFSKVESVLELKAIDNRISFLPCVPLAPQVEGIGAGYAFNKFCCSLMINVQLALNRLILNGTYQNIISTLLNDPRFANPLVKLFLKEIITPAPNSSIVKNFIPQDCLCTIRSDNLTKAILNKYLVPLN